MADDPALPHNRTMRLHAIARWGTKELHDGKGICQTSLGTLMLVHWFTTWFTLSAGHGNRDWLGN